MHRLCQTNNVDPTYVVSLTTNRVDLLKKSYVWIWTVVCGLVERVRLHPVAVWDDVPPRLSPVVGVFGADRWRNSFGINIAARKGRVGSRRCGRCHVSSRSG